MMIDINPNEQEERLLEQEMCEVTRCVNCGCWTEGLSIRDGFCNKFCVPMTGFDGCTRGEAK